MLQTETYCHKRLAITGIASFIYDQSKRKGILWKHQTKIRNRCVGGGLSAELLLAIIKNDDPAASQAKKRGLRPGTVIVRMWHDVKHEVTIRTNGYEYQGQLYRSLSAVAKKITGAHWNGKRFFQLGED